MKGRKERGVKKQQDSKGGRGPLDHFPPPVGMVMAIWGQGGVTFADFSVFSHRKVCREQIGSNLLEQNLNVKCKVGGRWVRHFLEGVRWLHSKRHTTRLFILEVCGCVCLGVRWWKGRKKKMMREIFPTTLRFEGSHIFCHKEIAYLDFL